ncbi:MAG: ribonuclease [Clostridiales bacterium]|nr:ribonuclease [Clostridiales bacterium]MDK2932607.1 ribonuclease [Clostridiales bacterium]
MNYSQMKIKEIDRYLRTLSIDRLQKEISILSTDARISVSKLVSKYNNIIHKHFKELERLQQMSKYEDHLYKKGIKYIAGVDEAGRGPLAGPVFAAAVILPAGILIKGLNDSKKLSESKREELYDIITEKAIAYHVTSVSEQEIDEINIQNATHKAMREAINKLNVSPQHVLIDGKEIGGIEIPYTPIIKGDSLSISIAAASILAKVSRDRYIKKFDVTFPQYGFGKHKGYGTKEHIEAIRNHGICPIHRKSFTLNLINDN